MLRHVLDAVALVVAFAAALPAAASASTTAAEYGVNLGLVTQLPPVERDRHLAQIAASGLTLARVDASWSGAEPAPPDPITHDHRYDWSAYDAIAGALAAHGLRWYASLDYSAPWAATIPGDLFSAPTDDAAFAAYARAFAGRYGSGGTFWAEHPELPRLGVGAYEIWNEPNSTMFWRDQTSAPERFADLYAAAHDAIHSVDPAADVVTGGLLDANATDPNAFLRRMIAHRPELRKSIDAVGYHPYQLSLEDMVAGVTRIRATMNGLGLDRVPIEVNEVGLSTAWVSESTRVRALRGMALDVPGGTLGVTRILPFEWLGGDSDPAKWDDWYGIVRRDGSLKPAGAAYVAAVRTATESSGAPASQAPATPTTAASPAASATRANATRRRRARRRQAPGGRERVIRRQRTSQRRRAKSSPR